MFGVCSLVLVSLLAALASTHAAPQTNGTADELHAFYEGPGVSAAAILRARGFDVHEFDIPTADGYKLRLVAVSNPLFANNNNNKEPILFVHGILEDASVFVINTFHVTPKDLTKEYNLDPGDLQSAAEQLAAEPSARSLPTLALNFGHPVYLLSRRGFPGSQQFVGAQSNNTDARFTPDLAPAQLEALMSEAVGRMNLALGLDGPMSRANPLTNLLGPFVTAPAALADNGNLIQDIALTFNTRFWNFSLDQQAAFDLPATLEFILKRENKRTLAFVGHSAGGAIFLMSLIDRPQMADQISAAILWSEGFSLGHGDIFEPLAGLESLLRHYIGPLPPPFLTTQFQAIAGIVCSTGLSQSTLCEGITDLILGDSGGMQPVKPQFLNTLLYSSSAGEIVQDLQCAKLGGTMHRFDFGSAEKNQLAYNQSEPPVYDLSRVTLDRMSFYVGATDFTVSAIDVESTLSHLKVPYKFQLINTTFNHESYFFHNSNAKLAIVPSFIDIVRILAQTK